MDLHVRASAWRLRQRLHAARHRARVPVLQHAARAEPHRERHSSGISGGGMYYVKEPDLGATVAGGRVVELELLGLAVGSIADVRDRRTRRSGTSGLAPTSRPSCCTTGQRMTARLDVLVVGRDDPCASCRVKGRYSSNKRLVDVDVVVMLPIPDRHLLRRSRPLTRNREAAVLDPSCPRWPTLHTVRCATAIVCQQSSRASPGGSTILNHCCVRRSELPNIAVLLDPHGRRQDQVRERVVAVG